MLLYQMLIYQLKSFKKENPHEGGLTNGFFSEKVQT